MNSPRDLTVHLIVKGIINVGRFKNKEATLSLTFLIRWGNKNHQIELALWKYLEIKKKELNRKNNKTYTSSGRLTRLTATSSE